MAKNFSNECLVEALIALMDDTPISEISVVNLVKKAGISRMTYYRNYECMEDILKRYLKDIIDSYSNDVNISEANSFGKFNNVKFSIKYFLKYERFTKCLIKANLTHILLDGLNNYILSKASRLNLKIDPIYLYAYSGAIFNIYLTITSGLISQNLDLIDKKIERLVNLFDALV